MKIRTSVNLCRLKQRVRETCREEKVWTCGKNSELEHIKIIGVLIDTCVPCASLEWYQNKVIEVGNIKGSKMESKKGKVCQND